MGGFKNSESVRGASSDQYMYQYMYLCLCSTLCLCHVLILYTLHYFVPVSSYSFSTHFLSSTAPQLFSLTCIPLLLIPTPYSFSTHPTPFPHPILLFLSSPHLLPYNAFYMQGYPEMVINPATGGKSFWPPWVVRRVLDDTLRGLVYLHTHDPPIIHRGEVV